MYHLTKYKKTKKKHPKQGEKKQKPKKKVNKNNKNPKKEGVSRDRKKCPRVKIKTGIKQKRPAHDSKGKKGHEKVMSSLNLPL